MIPTTTKQVPRPNCFSPVAAPSCCQAAPNTFFPRRLNSVSSTATVTAAPAGSSILTIRWASTIPKISAFHAEREKNACARSCDQTRARPAPVSIPVTMPFPLCAIRPVTIAAKVANVGAVNEPRRFSSTASSDAGNVRSGSIGGSPHAR
jgi:hypothetical protein